LERRQVDAHENSLETDRGAIIERRTSGGGFHSDEASAKMETNEATLSG
jgi:hypothetical protein